MGRGSSYSDETINEMIQYRKAGFTYKEIGEIVGRTGHAVELWFSKNRALVESIKDKSAGETVINTTVNELIKPVMTKTEPVKEKTLKDFQERDMIKYLYDRGYRIEDNRLVCYVKQVVKVNDIING